MENPLVRLEPGLFIWSIITFLVLLAFLARFVWKPLMGALERREKRIRESLEDARKAREEAERISREFDRMIARARSEAQAIVKQGKATGERLKQDMVARAKEESDRIRTDAEKRIGAEKQKAIAEIREEVVNLSLQVASKIIGKKLTRRENLSLIQESLERIDRGADA
ncbi:MAG: F0F1 ATP synthase subunit B [Fidelibacterota bacterium]